MQIKIDIEVKPEELRRFLGLPDVVGIQEDIVHFLRDKVEAASENFDPAAFVKDNLQTLRNSPAWRRLLTLAKVAAQETGAVPSKLREQAAGKRPRSNGARPRTRSTASRAAQPAAAAPDKADPAA